MIGASFWLVAAVAWCVDGGSAGRGRMVDVMYGGCGSVVFPCGFSLGVDASP